MPIEASSHAKDHWQYAQMCAFAYQGARVHRPSCVDEPTTFSATMPPGLAALQCAGWTRWAEFPSDPLAAQLADKGLYADVWERTTGPRTIAVVFKGTKPKSMSDWRANFRWFLRFLPSYEDHYTLAADKFCREFFAWLFHSSSRFVIRPGSPHLTTHSEEIVRLVVAGHSLGGGLAQHFAYAFQQPFASGGPKVSEVFAFDTSPVTGWSVVPRGRRTYNARNLTINRIFEHGEILAYLRLLTSRFVRRGTHPSVWEYRYNFGRSWNVLKNHSIDVLADGLFEAAFRTQGSGNGTGGSASTDQI